MTYNRGKYAGLQGFAILMFTYVLMDSLMIYFAKQFIGFVPVIALLPLFLLVVIFKWGSSAIMPPRPVVWALSIALIGLLFGVILNQEISWYRLLEIGGAFCAFFVGYMFGRWVDDADFASHAFLITTVLYVIVCVVALLDVMPSLFPVNERIWSYHGVLKVRPEITTDQNFQIFYLLPAVVVLAMPFKVLRFSLAMFATIGGLFVLAKLQTRSGALVLIGIGLLSVMAPIWTKELGRKKVFMVLFLIVVLVLLGLPWILEVASLLIARFIDTDYATAYGRLASITYLFEHIYDPTWWFPRGNTEFISRYGNTPHSNITAMFLEGGILLLGAWIALFVIPLVGLSRLFFKQRLDALATIILLAGVAVWVIQMSLNVPLVEQVWLWGGGVVGALYRSKLSLSMNPFSEPSEHATVNTVHRSQGSTQAMDNNRILRRKKI